MLESVIDRREVAAAAAAGTGGGRGNRNAPRTTPGEVSTLDIINILLAKDVDPSPQLAMHRPSRGGNSGRFIDPILNLGCTPLMRATMGGDMEVTKLLLAKGALPNVNAMGVTPFLVAAGVGTGGRGTGLAAQTGGNTVANLPLMDLLLQNGADLNAQVTGTKTYSMRISRASSSNEGMTALHVAAQSGRVDVVKYLIDKGINTELKDATGKKAIDLIASGAPATGAAPAAAAGGTRAPRAAGANSGAEIRALIENASKK